MTESKEVQRGYAEKMAWQFTEEVPHGKDLGMQVISIDHGKVCMRLVPKPWMLAAASTDEICTSVLYSLADSAGGLAVFAGALELTPIATLDLRMDYLRAASGEHALLAVATCLHLTNEVEFIRCDIRCEADSELLATATATFIRNSHNQRFPSGSREKEQT